MHFNKYSHRNLDPYSAYSYIIFGILSAILSLYLFAVLWHPKLGRVPGNFLRWVCFSDILTSIVMVYTGFNHPLVSNRVIKAGSDDCHTLAIITMAAKCLNVFYSISWLGCIIWRYR
jgi:uncharacterized membrane protein